MQDVFILALLPRAHKTLHPPLNRPSRPRVSETEIRSQRRPSPSSPSTALSACHPPPPALTDASSRFPIRDAGNPPLNRRVASFFHNVPTSTLGNDLLNGAVVSRRRAIRRSPRATGRCGYGPAATPIMHNCSRVEGEGEDSLVAIECVFCLPRCFAFCCQLLPFVGERAHYPPR